MKNEKKDFDVVIDCYKIELSTGWNQNKDQSLDVYVNGHLAEYLYDYQQVANFAEERKKEGMSVNVIYKNGKNPSQEV